MNKDLDTLLKQALAPTKEPDDRLNKKIMGQVKETDIMNMKKVRKIPAAAIAAVFVIATGSLTAYASWKYLTPESITKKLNDSRLTDAFQGKDAVSINETQTIAGYQVTFLGIVSGKDISQYESKSNQEILHDRSYCVTAVKREDGTPMPDTSEDAYSDLSFFVSPLIKGYDPVDYNVFTMHGNYTEFVEKLCRMARSMKRVSGKPTETDNDKYAFRCFLLRLGFIGDEYKAARKILLKNLTGNSAFRHGK